MRGGIPLDHIDSSPTADDERHVEDTPLPSRSHSSTTLPADAEKGEAPPPWPESDVTGPVKSQPAETRAWKDDIVLWNSKDDVQIGRASCRERVS